MVDLTEQLNATAALLQVAGLPGSAQPGQQIVARLTPPLAPIAFTDIVQQPIGLDLILKQVVFTDTGFTAPGWVEDPDITKILPMFNLAAGAIPTLDNSGAPGLIGRFKGNFPVAIPTEAIPTLTVEWTITDDDGNPLVQGDDFLAPDGLDNPSLRIVFLPAFERFDGAVPATVGRKLTATVELSAGGKSASRDIGPIRIEIPAIPFPKVLALTENRGFGGAALILVPGGSGVNSLDHLRAVLQPVRNVISSLTGIARFAAMLTGIDTLSGILGSANIEFRKGDRFNNLNDITLIQRAWYENDTEAEDELSALVYLSPPPPPRQSQDNMVELCNARDLGTGEGRFTLATGAAFVAICRDLHSPSPTATPDGAMLPERAVLDVSHTPPGGWFNPSDFGDALSSIRFL